MIRIQSLRLKRKSCHDWRELVLATGAWRFGHSRKRGSGCVSPSDMEVGIQALINGAVRGLAINSDVRPDGRGLTDLQPVHCEVGV